MNTKQIGFIIIGISILLLVVMVSLIKDLQVTKRGGCSCVSGTCPMEGLPVEGYVGITLSGVIGVFGTILVLRSKEAERITIKKK